MVEPVPRRIEDHGIIGDLRSCALVADDGTVDFFCWPHFDSPSVFTALLDDDSAGAFRLAPELPGARRLQLYLPDSNVLQTRWLSTAGIAEITDLMPIGGEGGTPRLVRHVQAVSGSIHFQLHCRVRHDYARADTRARRDGEDVLFEAQGQPSLRLSALLALGLDGDAAVARFTLRQGECVRLVLGGADDEAVDARGASRDLPETLAWWRQWIGRSSYRGRWRAMVDRSALALKLLTSRAHGSIAAAATFGLPEHLGGERNWDYRATWIRDASFTVYAFMRLGLSDEAGDFMHWVHRCVDTCPIREKLRIMYRMDGGVELAEHELPHLAGYAGSRPVRIGNGAHQQVQLDIYGELLDAVYLANKYGEAISHDGWRHVQEVVDYVCQVWDGKDAGIWEMRGEAQHFLHSRLMCWVALDRAIRLAAKRSLPMDYARWSTARSAIQADIWARFRTPDGTHFVSIPDTGSLDAAMLLMPLVRFVSATDPCWLATLDQIGERLVRDGMVRRYVLEDTPSDGLNGEEGAFVACSFWYVECLARAGRIDAARLEFEKLLGYANPLGLYAEEFDARGGHLGNTPQALSHLALISAAVFLDRKLDGDAGTWQP